MPFIRNVAFQTHNGGGLDKPVIDATSSFLRLIDEAVVSRAAAERLRTSQVRLLKPCRIAVAVSPTHIAVAYTNVDAGSGGAYTWHPVEGVTTTPDLLAQTLDTFARERLGLEDFDIIAFDRAILASGQTAMAEQANMIAKEIVDLAISEIERAQRVVKLNPVFPGRDFSIDRRLAFVLTPFRAPFDAIFRDHIRPAVESVNGMHALRADDIYDVEPVIGDIWKKINEARVVISELTGRNPNVFYETGIAHTVGKDVILITQEIADVPFDLRHYRLIEYSYTPPGVEELHRKLTQTLQTLVAKDKQ